MKSSRSNCSVADCFPKKSSWRRNEQVCHGVNYKVGGGAYLERSDRLDTALYKAHIYPFIVVVVIENEDFGSTNLSYMVMYFICQFIFEY